MINITMKSNSLLIKKPLISEKATELTTLNKYVFLVSPHTPKPEVKKAIESIYKVHVVKMNILNNITKDKKIRKAIVTLKEGEKIDIVPH